MPSLKMNKIINIIRCTLAVFLAASAVACSNKHDNFGNFEPLPEQGWAYNDTIRFITADLDSTATPRKLSIGVCHDNDYEYRNLIMEVTYSDINARLYRDTVNIELADIYGAWLGNGLGPIYQAETTISPAVHLADSGLITVRHVMRLDTLRGVKSIGIIAN